MKKNCQLGACNQEQYVHNYHQGISYFIYDLNISKDNTKNAINDLK